jgi:hypothetical protein
MLRGEIVKGSVLEIVTFRKNYGHLNIMIGIPEGILKN